MKDANGTIRPARDFEDALKVVTERMVSLKWRDDPMMMLSALTLRDALIIAISVARSAHDRQVHTLHTQTSTEGNGPVAGGPIRAS